MLVLGKCKQGHLHQKDTNCIPEHCIGNDLHYQHRIFLFRSRGILGPSMHLDILLPRIFYQAVHKKTVKLTIAVRNTAIGTHKCTLRFHSIVIESFYTEISNAYFLWYDIVSIEIAMSANKFVFVIEIN